MDEKVDKCHWARWFAGDIVPNTIMERSLKNSVGREDWKGTYNNL